MSDISNELKLAEEKGIQQGIEQEQMRIIQNLINISGSKHVAISLIKDVIQVSRPEAESIFDRVTDKTIA